MPIGESTTKWVINLTGYLCDRRWVIKATIKRLQRPLGTLSLPRARRIGGSIGRLAPYQEYTWQPISNSLDINYHAVWVFRLNDSTIVKEWRCSFSFSSPSSVSLSLFPFFSFSVVGWQFDCVAFCALIETQTNEIKSSLRGMRRLLSLPHSSLSLSYLHGTTQGTVQFWVWERERETFPRVPISARCGPHLPINYNWLAILTEIINHDYDYDMRPQTFIRREREKEREG